jgi:hypothetical protein
LRWWDDSGNLLLTGDERAVQAQAIANQATIAQQQAEEKQQQAEAIANQATIAQQQAEAIANQALQEKHKLEAYLRSIGVNPDHLP